mmetsp:Transcript_114960/g.199286  ORF Transcript_114960/g.199286 Transcript_114960/m.199286 type:complete len:146 (-) Transcript_114960:169-606(-)
MGWGGRRGKGSGWNEWEWTEEQMWEWMMFMMSMKGNGKGYYGYGDRRRGKGKGNSKGNQRTGPQEDNKRNPDRDMEGKPGPNGEDPSTGRWSFQSKGAGAGKRWKWKPIMTDEMFAAKKEKRRLLQEQGLAPAAPVSPPAVPVPP